ncbi:hypothetical protein KKG72_03235 [bacterium]|nr:hypothetical protein [bacterium]MBU1994200.1 hypothetical protein [bacterium]
MYISINKKPSKEEIATFNMKVSEEDSVIDYRIELASLDEAAKKVLCECYNLKPESIQSAHKVVFSYNNEI